MQLLLLPQPVLPEQLLLRLQLLVRVHDAVVLRVDPGRHRVPVHAVVPRAEQAGGAHEPSVVGPDHPSTCRALVGHGRGGLEVVGQGDGRGGRGGGGVVVADALCTVGQALRALDRER